MHKIINAIKLLLIVIGMILTIPGFLLILIVDGFPRETDEEILRRRHEF